LTVKGFSLGVKTEGHLPEIGGQGQDADTILDLDLLLPHSPSVYTRANEKGERNTEQWERWRVKADAHQPRDAHGPRDVEAGLRDAEDRPPLGMHLG
jgi:hypothetical protein